MVWVPQTSFRNGEVSPHVDAQARPKVYETSCRNLEGGIVSSGGSIEKRCGTVHEATTGGTGEGTYTSTAIKLIPYTHLSSQYVIVFEVVTANGKTWGIVTAVLNNTHPGAGSTNVMFADHGQSWLANKGCNLPFSSLPSSGASTAADYIPLGVDPAIGDLATDKNLFRSCGLHPFTAAQLEEVQYFQHEDSLILCHGEVQPFELFLSRSKGGLAVFDTRPYDCVHRSPPVDIRGQRFTLDLLPGDSTKIAGGGTYRMATNRNWFNSEDVGHIYRIGHFTLPSASSTATHSGVTLEQHDDRHGFFVRVKSVDSLRQVTVETISQMLVNGRSYVADISDPNDWDGPWVKETDGVLTFSHTVRGTEDTTGTDVATMSKSEMHITGIAMSGLNMSESSLVGCILGKLKTTDTTKEGYAIINAPSAKIDPEGVGSLPYEDTPFLATVINGDEVNIWQTAGSGLTTPTSLRNRSVYTIYDVASSGATLGASFSAGDTITFKDTGGTTLGTATVLDSGTTAPPNQPAGMNAFADWLEYYDPSTEAVLTETGTVFPTSGDQGTVSTGGGAEHDYSYIEGVARVEQVAGGGTGDLYRLVNKTGSAERYERTLCWTHQIGTEQTETGTQYYTTPRVGDKVFIHVGNTEKPSGGAFSSAATHASVPQDHESAFDTRTRGDMDLVAPQDEPKVGGVVHFNGGTFALSAKKRSSGNSTATTRLYYHAYVISPPANQSVTSKYSLGWSEGVGFPTCGTSHQGRVYFSGFERNPEVVVGSSAASKYDFTLGGTSPDAMHFIVNDMRGSLVRWMSSGKDLMVGTTTGEFAIGGAPLSPTSVGVERHSAYGSATVRPVIAGTYIFYVQKDCRTIRAQRFRFDNQRYMSLNITEDHRHLFKGLAIKELVVWEGDEDPVLLVRLSNGEVLSCRVNEQEGAFGWSRMKLPICAAISPARHYNTGGTVNATTGDDFYIAIDGTDKYHLSRYECDVYLDQSYTGTPAANVLTVTAGHPLRGQVVHIVADGLYKGTGTVDNTTGVLDFSASMGTTASSATVGLAIPFSVTPRVPEVVAGIRVTSTLGRMKNYSSVVVNVNGSKGVKVNGLEIDGVPLDLTSNQVTPHTEHTAWLECVATGLYGIQPLLVISSDRPYPVELCGYTVDMSVEG